MANTKITTNVIADDAITTAKIADDVALGGNPTTTTQSAGNNTTRVATTAFVTTAIAAINTSSAADDISTGDAAVTIGTSSGNITLDSPNKVILNADGGQVAFEDGSEEIGVFENSSSNFVIEAKVQDKDIIFKGNDGGSGITAMTIDMSAGGKVGIRDSTPDAVLKVNSTGGGSELAFKVADTSDNSVFEVQGGGTSVFQYGKVGIGTTSPDQMLHVSKGSAGSIDSHSTAAITIEDNDHVTLQFLTPNDKQQNIFFGDVQDNAHGIIRYDHSTTKLHLGTDGDPNKFILDNGKVAIGTTSFISNAALTVDGGDMMVSAYHNNIGMSDLLPGYSRGDYGAIYSSANYVYFVIGNSYVSNINTSGTYGASDLRLKTNVSTISGALDKVNQLRGVNFEWKEEERGTGNNLGFIAQEMEAVIPELVNEAGLPNNEKGEAPIKSVNYANLTSVLVEAIKEQQTIIEDLKTRIETLEG